MTCSTSTTLPEGLSLDLGPDCLTLESGRVLADVESDLLEAQNIPDIDPIAADPGRTTLSEEATASKTQPSKRILLTSR